MERIYTLIEKLYQQKAQNASPAHLLFTVQLLQQELSKLQTKTDVAGTRKVAVTLPMNLNFSEEILRTPFSEASKEKEIFVLDTIIDDEEELEIAEPVQVLETKEYSLQKPVVQEAVFHVNEPVAQPEPQKSYTAQPLYNSAFDTITEAPTLTQYAERKEVNHMIGEAKESLNDRLKEQKTEVAHLLKESPIKDLKKAIGINDRFVFVKELFRGDDAMYERSIKTINGFHIFSEAEYWMTRELKFKLGWDDTNETVKHFYQLVRRRFS